MNRKSLADTLADLHAQYDQARDSLEQARDSESTLEAECASITTTLAQMETDRRALLRRALLLSTPQERAEKGFHEIYLHNGIRVTIYAGERTKK